MRQRVRHRHERVSAAALAHRAAIQPRGASYSVQTCLATVYSCAGIVSYSSRIIAAMRAIEDEEPDKLFDDPLARVLAGDKAMKRVYQLLKVQLTAPHLAPPQVKTERMSAASCPAGGNQGLRILPVDWRLLLLTSRQTLHMCDLLTRSRR